MTSKVENSAADRKPPQEHWNKLETRLVNVANIETIDRIIPPTEARINAMMKSLSGPLGQINPILITKHLYSSWKVVAGATRLAAAKQLGMAFAWMAWERGHTGPTTIDRISWER